jgi:hypothetical protein
MERIDLPWIRLGLEEERPVGVGRSAVRAAAIF